MNDITDKTLLLLEVGCFTNPLPPVPQVLCTGICSYKMWLHRVLFSLTLNFSS